MAVSRFGNIYGPGDLNLNRLIPGIMKAIVTGQTLDLRSDGQFIRDYVYVKDVADGYVTLMEQMDIAKGEAFNFSTGYNFTVIDLIEHVSSILGKACGYRIVNTQQNEIPTQSLNFDKAIEMLGWKSRHTFEEGIRETFRWYREYLGR